MLNIGGTYQKVLWPDLREKCQKIVKQKTQFLIFLIIARKLKHIVCKMIVLYEWLRAC